MQLFGLEKQAGKRNVLSRKINRKTQHLVWGNKQANARFSIEI
jgi:hypothetical protein